MWRRAVSTTALEEGSAQCHSMSIAIFGALDSLNVQGLSIQQGVLESAPLLDILTTPMPRSITKPTRHKVKSDHADIRAPSLETPLPPPPFSTTFSTHKKGHAVCGSSSLFSPSLLWSQPFQPPDLLHLMIYNLRLADEPLPTNPAMCYQIYSSTSTIRWESTPQGVYQVTIGTRWHPLQKTDRRTPKRPLRCRNVATAPSKSTTNHSKSTSIPGPQTSSYLAQHARQPKVA
ncbi:hypothetical protein BDV96DRAFT_388498 [Lophiotrema nucula]|uniref:Uncharacterized protein n=1 Tax=Lophiotrema nucula TaxID=690887 RepID=A0A6A5ZG91_9PLEO|nr:hypothetical protein BDV96DRAFT_388498 [Lophiotrema nucula]